jgi:hypothetical protein
MTSRPDFHSYVKVILDDTGAVIPDGGSVTVPAKVIVRYVVVNDSHKTAGPWLVTGGLKHNGITVNPTGKTTGVVPVQNVTLQPDTVWKKEWKVTAQGNYVANIFSIGSFDGPPEEDSKNNIGKMSFSIDPLPPG